MKNLVFATNNPNKLKEIRNAVSDFKIISLNELNINEDIPETGNTLQENALQKASYIFNKTGENCFADDTGLEIQALNNQPGVYSARYAGENCTPEDNIQKVLSKLNGIKNRNAKFKTVITLILNDKTYFFEGEVKGIILEEKTGDKGFGYDPIFRPNGFDVSFAQMSTQQKNEISHRGLAVKKLVEFLQNKQ
ncbi:MAG: non-canonical purine NTP pyrophosphatase [Crocinitomicaceae bacterium]|nr:non-canonical purine NTP pyrophosphatase [Crocinitomicaceae bacterium]